MTLGKKNTQAERASVMPSEPIGEAAVMGVSK